MKGAYRVRRAKLQLRNLKHERDEKDWLKRSLAWSDENLSLWLQVQEYSQRAAVKLKIERERQEKLKEQKAALGPRGVTDAPGLSRSSKG